MKDEILKLLDLVEDEKVLKYIYLILLEIIYK